MLLVKEYRLLNRSVPGDKNADFRKTNGPSIDNY
jgi:hypothetical protein